jgi:beta-1,4-mannosyl-glycoprotein beta-1,4-N-acetylglucosaminyltransferase
MEYSMTIKLIDCFIFYNELELLNYRLTLLNDIVDYFVLVESTHSFIGKKKDLFYNDNKELFKKFNKKIIHLVVDDFPFKSSTHKMTSAQIWKNEKFQRNAISYGIHDIHPDLNDIIIISDVDEIPDPRTLTAIKHKVSIHSLQMDFYYYNLNTHITTPWILSKILSYKKYRELNKECDDIRNMECPLIVKGGWHLSYFGDANFIKNKIKNFSHQELNTNEFTDIVNIEDKIKQSKDLFNRKIKIKKINIKDNTYLPPKYDKYLNKFYTLKL